MPASTRPTRLSTFAALRAPNYCLYWSGLVFYVLGHRAEYMTFGWITWQITHDPLALGYLGLAQGIPLVVFQLFGGVLADRTDRLRLLLVTQILTAATLTVAFVLTVTGAARLAHLLALAAASSVFRAFDEPSRLSLVPQLIDRERLPNAIALGSIPWQAGRMIGPSVTGVLIATLGGPVGFGVAAASSYIALLLYSRIRIDRGTPTSDGGHVLGQFAEGLGYVARHFVFASLIGLSLFNSLFGMSYITLLPIFADVHFAAGSTGYGLLNAAHGAGAMIGTLTLATISHRIVHRGRSLLLGATAVGIMLMAFSTSPVIWLAMLLLAAAGFSNTFYLTQVTMFIQQNVPDHLRGRVLSIYSLCWNLMPLGGLIGGSLAALAGARVAVACGGALVSANALALMTSRRLRRLV